MLNALRGRLTYANVMATVAVFIALGGGAYAVTLAKNTVKSKQIAKNAVKSAEIAKGAVKSAEVATNAIGSAQIGDGQVLSADIGDGQIGNADIANSLRLSCPSDTLYHEGACIEAQPRAAAQFGAARNDCFFSGRRLASLDELLTFMQEPGVELAGDEWTSFSWRDDGVSFAKTVNESGGHAEVNLSFAITRPYRCVTSPLR